MGSTHRAACPHGLLAKTPGKLATFAKRRCLYSEQELPKRQATGTLRPGHSHREINLHLLNTDPVLRAPVRRAASSHHSERGCVWKARIPTFSTSRPAENAQLEHACLGLRGHSACGSNPLGHPMSSIFHIRSQRGLPVPGRPTGSRRLAKRERRERCYHLCLLGRI